MVNPTLGFKRGNRASGAEPADLAPKGKTGLEQIDRSLRGTKGCEWINQ